MFSDRSARPETIIIRFPDQACRVLAICQLSCCRHVVAQCMANFTQIGGPVVQLASEGTWPTLLMEGDGA
jgi:hypothetical protein